jgi:hypothetical protein
MLPFQDMCLETERHKVPGELSLNNRPQSIECDSKEAGFGGKTSAAFNGLPEIKKGPTVAGLGWTAVYWLERPVSYSVDLGQYRGSRE